MNLEINNKVAIVTGASRGMGLACAKTLARAGVKVLMIARNNIELRDAAHMIAETGGIVEVLSGDVKDTLLPQSAVSICEDLWGGVDILINNAGGPPMGTFLDHDGIQWESAIQTNLLSVVRFCQAVVPGMKKRKWGRIISISSSLAKEPTPSMVLSATSRAGLSAFNKSIAIELAQSNITSNVICPGGVLTERLVSLINDRVEREGGTYDELLKKSEDAIPAKRFADPQEISDIVVFLASERASYITGVSLSVDGGLTRAFT
jgi:3-oxoacyl-[acyl-carrier protein] reductase